MDKTSKNFHQQAKKKQNFFLTENLIKCSTELNFWFTNFFFSSPDGYETTSTASLFCGRDVPKRIAPKKGKNNTEIKHHSKVFCLIML
jgi:hypothetical protein